MAIRSRRLSAGGRPIAYVECASPEPRGLPLVFVHGAGGDRHSWLPLMVRLAREEAAGIALELPGHGRSGGEGCRSVGDYARVVLEFLDATGLGTSMLAGHSMGGAVALELALNSPERLGALVLVGTGARLRVLPAILDGLRRDFGPTVERLVEYAYSPQAPRELLEGGRERLARNSPEVLLGDFTACDAFDVMDRLGEIRLPTLVVCGEEDRLTPTKYARYLAEHIAGASLSLLPGAGHMVMLERTEEVARAILRFRESL